MLRCSSLVPIVETENQSYDTSFIGLYLEAAKAQFDAPCEVCTCYIRENRTVVLT